MKNDIMKIEKITAEMRINDLLYKTIDNDFEQMLYNCEEISDDFEKLYFARRVLSVLESNDIPIRSAVGLLDNVLIIENLFIDKEKYIGESDSDADILNYVIEHGYRHYDEIVLPFEKPEAVFIRIAEEIFKAL